MSDDDGTTDAAELFNVWLATVFVCVVIGAFLGGPTGALTLGFMGIFIGLLTARQHQLQNA
jgi:hypothetical protein